jgi:hypothetical protein
MPQAVMPIGCIILGLVLVRGIVRRVQRLRRREF